MIRYIFHKRPPAHKINFNVWSVENAEVLPLIYLLCNIGEGFVDITYHLGVNSNLNIKRQFLTKEYPQPILIKGVLLCIALFLFLFVSLPIPPDKLRVIIKPSFL